MSSLVFSVQLPKLALKISYHSRRSIHLRNHKQDPKEHLKVPHYQNGETRETRAHHVQVNARWKVSLVEEAEEKDRTERETKEN